MIRGSCLCGSVLYEISGALYRLLHCHCSQCRKAHGAAFGTYARVKRADFRFLAGESDVVSYASSPGVRRTFCQRCGASLQFIRDSKAEALWITAGTLDVEPDIRPSHHIFVASKAPWFEITDGLPQYEQGLPPT